MEASTVEAYHEYTALSCFTAFQKQLAQFDKLCPWILKNSTNRKKKNDKSETLRPVGKKCKIPRCKTHSKLTLASEVSRSHQNFPILKFFKIPFYTLQPQEKFHSEYLLGLVYNHFGRPAKQSHERGGTSICGLPYVCVTQHDMLFASLTLEQGIKLNLHLWKMTVFYFIFTDRNRGSDFFPWEPPIILDQA